jgi:protein phosphatase 2C family protein 2/3
MQSTNFEATINEAILEAFKTTDLMYQDAFPDLCKTCGSTAVVCLIIGNQIVCANLGDARAVLSREGKAYDMSVDYKASRKDE